MSTVFTREQKVLFRHCDPAGIAFFPRYFEIMNDLVEGFFDALGHPFERLHATGAVPTVQIEAGFQKPSRHGDRLALALSVEAVGRTSATLNIRTTCNEEARMTYRATLVLVGEEGRPRAWPEDLRAGLSDFMESEKT